MENNMIIADIQETIQPLLMTHKIRHRYTMHSKYFTLQYLGLI